MLLQGCSAPPGKQRARGRRGLSTEQVLSPAVLAFTICRSKEENFEEVDGKQP